MLDQATAVAIAEELLPQLDQQAEDIDRLDRWYRADMDDATPSDRPYKPARARTEHNDLADRSFTPWLRLVVGSVSQGMYVDGYRQPNDKEEAPAWAWWQLNKLDSRQIAVHRGMLGHGLSFTSVLPGEVVVPGTKDVVKAPVIKGVSARKLFAVYSDPAEDDWPMHALRRDGTMLRVYDEEAIHYIQLDGTNGPGDGPSFQYISHDIHGAGVCPIVRFANVLDLDGRISGEIGPFIPLAARIDQDTFDRLAVQRFGAWKVRWATGLVEPETDEQKRAAQLVLGMGDLLVNESTDAKFGTLDATDLAGYIAARDADIRDLAAVTQTPPHHLLGQIANLSAEALAAAEASLSRKIDERETTTGESWEQTLELASGYMGIEVDTAAQVRWRDMESRSLAQTADALGKLAQMLGVPPQMLWEKIPGWTDQDVQRAKDLLAENDELGQLIAQMTAQATPVAP